MHECKKINTKKKLEVTEACLNGPKSACCRENVTNLQRTASASLGGDIQDMEQVYSILVTWPAATFSWTSCFWVFYLSLCEIAVFELRNYTLFK